MIDAPSTSGRDGGRTASQWDDVAALRQLPELDAAGRIDSDCPGVFVIAKPGVARDVERAVLRAARLVPRVCDVRHPILVFLQSRRSLPLGRRDVTGIFSVPDGGTPTIELAAACLPFYQRQRGTTRREVRNAFVLVFLHEVAHYEQWRDGRPFTERNAHRRADSLFLKCCEILTAKRATARIARSADVPTVVGG